MSNKTFDPARYHEDLEMQPIGRAETETDGASRSRACCLASDSEAKPELMLMVKPEFEPRLCE